MAPSEERYTRANPSPRYRELLGFYEHMHRHGDPEAGLDPEDTFDGRSLPPQAPKIAHIISRTGARTLLDYGSGKGKQYAPQTISFGDGTTFDSVAQWWGVESITCFDPGYPEHATLPTGKFDGVVCTDVMEHCPAEDLPWILDEIFGYARKFVFLSVAQYPAVKTLPNGENAHCTIESTEWWGQRFLAASAAHPGVEYFVSFVSRKKAPDGTVRPEEALFHGGGKGG